MHSHWTETSYFCTNFYPFFFFFSSLYHLMIMIALRNFFLIFSNWKYQCWHLIRYHLAQNNTFLLLPSQKSLKPCQVWNDSLDENRLKHQTSIRQYTTFRQTSNRSLNSFTFVLYFVPSLTGAKGGFSEKQISQIQNWVQSRITTDTTIIYGNRLQKEQFREGHKTRCFKL